MTEKHPNGGSATIREVHSLVETLRTEVHQEFRQLHAQTAMFGGELIGLKAEVKEHMSAEGHVGSLKRIERLKDTINRWSGALAVLIVTVNWLVPIILKSREAMP